MFAHAAPALPDSIFLDFRASKSVDRRITVVRRSMDFEGFVHNGGKIGRAIADLCAQMWWCSLILVPDFAIHKAKKGSFVDLLLYKILTSVKKE